MWERVFEHIISKASVHIVLNSQFSVSCPDLIRISNGGLLLNGSTPGEIATYFCNDGYQLVGNTTRTCQENGEWSGQPPECVQCTGNGCLNEGTTIWCAGV